MNSTIIGDVVILTILRKIRKFGINIEQNVESEAAGVVKVNLTNSEIIGNFCIDVAKIWRLSNNNSGQEKFKLQKNWRFGNNIGQKKTQKIVYFDKLKNYWQF